MMKSEIRPTKMRNNSSSDLQRSKLNHTTITIQSEKDKEENAGSQKELVVLGISLDSLPRAGQFSICCGGVFLFYLIYGYVQEWIFRTGMKSFGWFLTLVQFGFYTVFGLVETSLKSDKTRKIPLKTYSLLAFLTVATMGLSNTSLKYLNYPTQVIFKCCKLIPVMIGGIIIQGKMYRLVDYLACICMSVGLILFTLADSTVQPEFNRTGVVLISLALCADAVIGNVQEKAMKAHKSSNTEVVLYSYGIGFFYILIGDISSGEFWPAFKYYLQNPVQAFGLAFIFSISGYLGITFVLTLVRAFGALLAVTVTTGRKAATMVLSFIFFAKPFTIHYVWSGFIVLFGIFLNIYSKNEKLINAWVVQQRHKYTTFLHKQKRTPLMEMV
ncbi:adenosine 3'-phospho 5'-phosphosulfate transporter 2-like [Montipora foliosa]|uniref:adenosine 3'-phospho 5'-phosphosulfate transporter 2-like n=1 Tax=Montipora foliosa TaxID=591990 RepID=UPI0035F1D491